MPRPSPYSAQVQQEIVEAYVKNISIHELERLFGGNRRTIKRLLLRSGIVTRTVKEACPGLPIDYSAFAEPLSTEAAYWIGFMMSDGNISDSGPNQKYISLSISARDIEHVRLFKSFLKSDHKIGIRKGRFHDGVFTRECARIGFASDQIAADLARYGVTPRKSLTAIALAEVTTSRDFWRGMIDGDGSMGIYGRTNYKHKLRPLIQLAGTKGIVQQFTEYAAAFGATSQARLSKGTLWIIGITGNPAIRLVTNLYDNCCVALARKQAIADKIMMFARQSSKMAPLS